MKDKNIIISNPKRLEVIKKKIKKGGGNKFHVIADFDNTLTLDFVKGKRSPVVIAQIRAGGYLTPDYPAKAYALYDKYSPIETSSKIPLEEKKKEMNNWWREHFNLLIECGMNKKVIMDIIKKRKILFRKGVLKFLDNLNLYRVPLIIMSAGPGDMIQEYLKLEKRLYENIHIIANSFKFDKTGKAIGVSKPTIHAFNKTETSVKHLPIYNELLKRKNVLLLGDNLGDVGMIEGFPYDNLIKIGFLNVNIDERLEGFKENYDVIITNDGDMSYVNELIKELLG